MRRCSKKKAYSYDGLLEGIEMWNFQSFVTKRRSIRQYRSIPVSRELIERILSAGIWAPSAHNAQPWRFVVITSDFEKQKLAKAMGRRYQRDLAKDGCSPEEAEKITKASIERFSTAPVLVLVGLTMEPMDTYPDSLRQKVEHVMAIQSVAAATQNILLAIQAEGLGACWYCAPLFCPDLVRSTLNLPTPFEPQALITLGFPAETPDSPPRDLLDEVVFYKD